MNLPGRLFVFAAGTIFAATISGGAALASPIFSLIGTSGNVGDGNLSVAINQSGGWGFQITNDSATDWIASNVSDFCPSSSTTPPCDANTWFLAGVDTFGPYTDQYGPDFVVVAPGTTVTENFSSGVSGVGSIALSRSGINVGDSQSGNILFVYDLYDGDPNGSGSQIGGDLVASASATVTATASTPEASTAGLLTAGLAVALLYVCRGARPATVNVPAPRSL